MSEDPSKDSDTPTSKESKSGVEEPASAERAEASGRLTADRLTTDFRDESSVTRVNSQPGPAAQRAPLDAEGRERPAFLLNFPEDEALEQLMQAFERGDFWSVRQRAPELIEKTDNAQVRAAAEQLLMRIDPSPTLKLFLWTSLALIAFMVLWTYW